MKRLIVSVLSIFPLLIIFNSCEKSSSLEFKKVDTTKIYYSPLVNDTSKGYCKVDIQFLYPVSGASEEILKKIQSKILLYAFDSSYVKYDAVKAVSTFANVTFSSFEKVISSAESVSVNEFNNEEWTMETSLLFNEKGLLSYELVRYAKVANKLRMNATQYLVFDLETGDKITEKDIFEEGFEPKLAELLKQQIMLDNGFESEEQMINNGFFFAMNIRPNNNFSITEEGITYIFIPDEIAVFSLGSTEVFIPYSKILSVLKEDSQISKLFKK